MAMSPGLFTEGFAFSKRGTRRGKLPPSVALKVRGAKCEVRNVVRGGLVAKRCSAARAKAWGAARRWAPLENHDRLQLNNYWTVSAWVFQIGAYRGSNPLSAAFRGLVLQMLPGYLD
jgi:hypothetical protein